MKWALRPWDISERHNPKNEAKPKTEKTQIYIPITVNWGIYCVNTVYNQESFGGLISKNVLISRKGPHFASETHTHSEGFMDKFKKRGLSIYLQVLLLHLSLKISFMRILFAIERQHLGPLKVLGRIYTVITSSRIRRLVLRVLLSWLQVDVGFNK